jgi:aryl-alcohol dehydrogenase-like predicted oxidoreductase
MSNVAPETIAIPGTKTAPTRIALGTWSIGGWMWGGTDDQQSIRTIQSALDRGINLIDTAPVYGFGHSEQIVGKALAESGRRQNVVIATKVCLDWHAALEGAAPLAKNAYKLPLFEALVRAARSSRPWPANDPQVDHQICP